MSLELGMEIRGITVSQCVGIVAMRQIAGYGLVVVGGVHAINGTMAAK